MRIKLSRSTVIKIGFLALCLIMSIVWMKRKEIAEMKITQKKMEVLHALYKQEFDSARHVIEEMVDSLFYLK